MNTKYGQKINEKERRAAGITAAAAAAEAAEAAEEEAAEAGAVTVAMC